MLLTFRLRREKVTRFTGWGHSATPEVLYLPVNSMTRAMAHFIQQLIPNKDHTLERIWLYPPKWQIHLSELCVFYRAKLGPFLEP